MKEYVKLFTLIKQSSDTDEIERALSQLVNFKEMEVVDFLIELLNNENYDWRIKNAIAVALGDIGFDEAVPALMSVVLNHENDGYSGTFLWALTIKPLQCQNYFLDFINLLCTGSLEIRDSAIVLIEEFYSQVSKDVIEESLKVLSTNKILLEANYNDQNDDSVINFIEYAQRLLLTRGF